MGAERVVVKTTVRTEMMAESFIVRYVAVVVGS